MSELDRCFVEDHVSFVFESICRNSIHNLEDRIGFVPTKVGSYWNKNTELDVVALNVAEKKAFIAECRYCKNAPVGFHVLSDLKNKCSLLKELDDYEIVFGLFSVSGFDDRLMREKDVVLIDKGKMITNK